MVQPFDLMSRRHPLSSVGTDAGYPVGSNDVPAKPAGISKSGETYFFFLATLRVFFAVFFTALFAFFAFFAFLAIVPSDLSEMALQCCVHSGIEMHDIPNTPTQRKKQLPA
jgi:hypothetical protein